MMDALILLFSFLKSGLKNQTELALENLALRQQPAILKRNRPHPSLLRSVAFTTIIEESNLRYTQVLAQ